jgi:hypothetical protein
LYDANLNSLGAFQTFSLDADGNCYSTPGSSTSHNYIQSGQAFFVASDGGNITIKENSKAGASGPLVFRALHPKQFVATWQKQYKYQNNYTITFKSMVFKVCRDRMTVP